MVSWTEKYQKIANEDGSVDIVLPEPPKKMLKTFRIPGYQLDYLKAYYDAENMSDSIRTAIDDLIKLKNGVSHIVFKEKIGLGKDNDKLEDNLSLET